MFVVNHFSPNCCLKMTKLIPVVVLILVKVLVSKVYSSQQNLLYFNIFIRDRQLSGA